MATAMPSSRWGPRAGCSCTSCWKRCFTDVAWMSNCETPPVICARFPTSATRATVNRGAPTGPATPPRPSGPADTGTLLYLPTSRSDLVEAFLLQGLQDLRRRHRELREPDARRLLHGVGHRGQRRHDGRLADPAHAVRMARVRDLHDDRVDLRHVGGHGHAVVEEARVLHLPVGAVDVFLVQRPSDALHGPALELPLDVGGMQGAPGVLRNGVAEDRR